LGFFRGKFHSKSLYSVEKTIVGISQYAYFSYIANICVNTVFLVLSHQCNSEAVVPGLWGFVAPPSAAASEAEVAKFWH
jgi:hypothetical protein